MGYRRIICPQGLAASAVALAVLCPQPASAQQSTSTEEQVKASGEALAKANSGDAPPPEAEDSAAHGELGATAAADATISDRQVYTPGDFARYAPRNAFNMLQNVPGFSIEGGGIGQRGLGEASGNVLINMERFSSKSVSIFDQLGRIPAGDVVRIEVVDGAKLDIPGLTGRVANVVTKRRDGLSGQFSWTAQLPGKYSDFKWTEGSVSVSGTKGALNYTVAVSNSPFIGGSIGTNVETDLTGRRVYESSSRLHAENPRVQASAQYRFAGGAVANLSGSYRLGRFRTRSDEVLFEPVAAPAIAERSRSSNDTHEYEIGGDFEFGLGPGRLKLIALESFVGGDSTNTFTVDPADGRPESGSRFVRASESGERIGRAEDKWAMLGGDWQISGEAAFNRLENVSSLFGLAANGDFFQIPFPNATGGVTEDRYESLVSYGRPLGATLSMQMSVGAEYSHIAQTGANALSRTFFRPKGTFSLAWAPRDDLDLSLKIGRRVGQLNFADFLATVNLQQNNRDEGNNELRPQQSWEFELEAVKDFGPWGALTLRAFDREIEDFVTLVPLDTGGESTGNLASAREWGLGVNGTLRLDQLGVKGAKIDLNGTFRKSVIEDPVTGRKRPFDRFQARNINFDFRHDVPGSDWAYGAGYRNGDYNPGFRIREITYDYNNLDDVRAFVENKDIFGLTVRAQVFNLLDNGNVYRRTVFAGPRGSAAPVILTEERRRHSGRAISFSVRGSF